MRDINAQALFTLGYLAPNDNTNLATDTNGAKNIGFYRLGMEAELELNANIKKLQLGCGGVNGAGGCDIDIDQFSLSGVANTSNARAASSAVLTNPFIEFAIKNPQSAALREIVGLRLSAENARGMLTFGNENSATPNGINTLSGYMEVAAQPCSAATAASSPSSCAGIAQVAGRQMTQTHTGKNMTGRVNVDFLGIGIKSYIATNYNITLAPTTAPFGTEKTVVYGNRKTAVPVVGTAYIQPINFYQNGLDIEIQNVLGSIDLDMTKDIDGYITNLQAAMTLDENLGYIHKVIADSPFSLSVQNASIHWPGMKMPALKGWWMAFDDPVDIGKLTPTNSLAIPDSVLVDTMGTQGCSTATSNGGVGVNCALWTHYRVCNGSNATGTGCGGAMAYCDGWECFGGKLSIGQVSVAGTTVPFPLAPLQLAGQNFAPNCWGNLKFC